MPIALCGLATDQVAIPDADLHAFASSLEGKALQPADPGYEDARKLWNAMIDRKPGLIVQCVGANDVEKSVGFARQHGVLTAVRGAGHNIAGNALCDGGLVIDLSGMRDVKVDSASRRVRVQPGATLGDLDGATQAFGLAVPVGINSTTGIAGLTLGGGFGWLSRKYGLTVDSLLSAEVVTADGKQVTASASSHPDLFWAIRGGGGNFGVVTSFEFQAHPVGPEVMSGLVVYDQADGPALLRKYREFAAKSPDELTVWVVLRKAPPLPFLPESVHGTDILVLAALYSGSVADGEQAVQPLLTFGTPLGKAMFPHRFTDFQTAFDPLLTPGARNYWKSHNFTGLSDGLIDVLLANAASLPSPQSEIFIGQLGGATSRVAPDATAYEHRDAQFIMNVHTRWEDPSDDARCIRWARSFFEASRPFATGGVYVNFMPEDETDRIGGAYGRNYARLAKVKKQYDPNNFFRVNQNIRPE